MSTVPDSEDANKSDLDTIARELLGIDISAPEIDDDVLDLADDELPPVDSPPVADEDAASPVSAESTVRDAAVSADDTDEVGDFDSDFGGGLGLLESEAGGQEPEPREVRTPQRSPRPAPASAPASAPEEVIAHTPTVAAAKKEKTKEETGERSPETPEGEHESDEYWDALNGWDWEDGERSSREDRTTDEAMDAVIAADDEVEADEVYPGEFKTDEFNDDDEFGAGLDEDESSARDRPRRSAPRESDEDQSSSRSRRGGRRRGRKPKRVAAEAEPVRETASASDVSDDASDDASDEASDGFGAGLEVEAESAPESGPRSSRRQRSRDRGRRRRGSRDREATVDDDELSATSEQDDEDDAVEDDSRERTRDKYRNVPSWEEAISCLVQVKRRSESRQSSERSSDKDGRRSDGSRQSRRRGGGRGRGRRRSSDG